ncbi:MAG: flagellar basal body P-ring formation chaperone FlgA [Desulfobacterales bacterium]|nr:flagellar basal body P-ring formation chaperone FlgA [Desulfobacterales bacterium]
MTTGFFSLLIAGLSLLLAVAGAGPARALEFPLAVDSSGAQVVDQARIRGLLDAFLVARADMLPMARVRFKSVEEIRPFELPAGVATCEIVPALPAIIGSRRFSLIFRVNGRVKKNLALRTDLEALAPVAVAAISLPRGAVIAPGDVRMVERDLSGLRQPCLDAGSLVGKKVRRTLRAGEVLLKGLLKTPPVVRRGDLVTMTLRSGGMVLTARGAARENGVTGATIRVRNNASHKEILCRVTGPGTVVVEM